jgi:hypothetical protein
MIISIPDQRLTAPLSRKETKAILALFGGLDRDALRSLAFSLVTALAEAKVVGHHDQDPISDEVGYAAMRMLDAAMQSIDEAATESWESLFFFMTD